jgi:predicted RNase H-like nuclease (RuvC/YqgF family)
VASEISLAVADGDSVTTTDSTPDSVSRLTDSTTAGPVTTTDPLRAIQTLSQTVEMLREDVGQERDRADQAERQVEIERQLVEEGRKRIDELQASLADERRRIDGLHTELADARTTAMISGSEAAVLRTRLTLLTDERRRPWRRRWFR